MSSSAIFVARFTDGEVVRMSVHTNTKKLDFKRGRALAFTAYEARCRRQQIPATPLAAAHFETADGVVLQSYTQTELEKSI